MCLFPLLNVTETPPAKSHPVVSNLDSTRVTPPPGRSGQFSMGGGGSGATAGCWGVTPKGVFLLPGGEGHCRQPKPSRRPAVSWRGRAEGPRPRSLGGQRSAGGLLQVGAKEAPPLPPHLQGSGRTPQGKARTPVLCRLHLSKSLCSDEEE